MEAHKLTGKPPRWHVSALALAATVAIGAFSPQAHALALGRITVQSALGEPLRADIDIPEITPEEAASLRATVASPEAFRAAGLEYNAAMGSLVITLQQRPGGRMFLRLASDRPVNEPFIDLILEANWSSGRIVRDYTMLFDPPNLRPAAPAAPSVAQLPAAPIARPAAPAPLPAPVAPPPAVTQGITSRPAPTPAPRPVAPAPASVQQAAPRPAPPAVDGRKVTVQAGDTAGKIAAANKPASVSLDQMLVALLRANPDAFIAGNINRVKTGAVLDLPSAEQAALVEPGEAGRTVVAQSRDFNEFRRKLAEGVPTSRVTAADRQASGRLQAKVEDKKPAAAAPDKLTLSKSAVQAKAAEDKIAKERQDKEAAARVAELNKNIAELSKLGTATSATAAAPTPAIPAAAAAPKPGIAVASGAAPTAPVAPVATPAAAASAPVAATAPAAIAAASAAASTPVTPAAAPAVAAAASASAPATAATPAPAAATKPPAPKPAPAPAPAPEPTLVDELLDNPLIPAAVAALLALVLGFVFYRARQRKKSTQVDSSFLESRLQPDSFFGASGGQRIDTNEGGPTGSSMVYSPSQLDAAGDVDPVAEADVYLAYGRDLQAEEILKEALRTNPQRVAIHGKLLEIYSKRRDAKAFEMVATDAYSLTRGEGPEWEHICELGQELDPSNPMYRPGGEPAGGTGTVAMAAVPAASGNDFSMATATHVLPSEAAAAPSVDLDLDLDFSLGDDEPSGLNTGPDLLATAPMQLEPTVSFNATPPPESPSLDMDFGSGTVALPPSAVPDLPPMADEPVRLSAPDLTLSENELSFSLDGLDLPAPTPAPPAASKAAAPVAAPAEDSGMIEFDMGALSLDLGSAPAASPASAELDSLPSLADAAETAGSPLSTGFDDSGSDPLATKLALAEEFNAIGDPDGARSLAEEVVAEASGALKVRAQKFLAELS